LAEQHWLLQQQLPHDSDSVPPALARATNQAGGLTLFALAHSIFCWSE